MTPDRRRSYLRSAAALAGLSAGLALLLGPGAQQGQGRTLGGPHPFATFNVSRYVPDIPWDGPISTIAVDPSDYHDVVVASDSMIGNGTIFSSADAGVTWRQDDNFPGTRVQTVAYYPYNAGLWNCPCILATTAPDFQANGGGGLWYTSSLSPPRTWSPVPGVLPSAGCPGNPAVHDISISPVAPHVIYVGTDCGIAVITPHGPGTSPTVVTKTFTGGAIPTVESLLSLPNGNLIVAGPDSRAGDTGIWYTPDDGDHWTQSRLAVGSSTIPFNDTVGDDRGLAFVHAFAADPRLGSPNGAFLVAADPGDTLHLFQTTDGGVTWNTVPITLGTVHGGCGGMPNVHAFVQGDNELHLYVGDRCHIYTAHLLSGEEPYQQLTTDSWSQLAQTHDDTRDLAFRPDLRLPYLEASDGGIARSTDNGASFQAIHPTSGLNALQITEITGQVPRRGATPDLYFATWHDQLWSMHGTSTTSADSATWEGFDFGLPAYAPATHNKVTFTACSACNNFSADPPNLSAGSSLFSDAERTPVVDPHTGMTNYFPVSNPIFIRPQEYAQGVDSSYSGGSGFALTGDGGSTWHKIANVSQDVRGWIRPAGPASNPTLFFPYFAGLDSSPAHWDILGLGTIKNLSLTAPPDPGTHATCSASDHNCLTLQSMTGFGSLGVTPTDMAWYPVYSVAATNPDRLIAVDVGNGNIQISTHGGSSWTPIPGLADLVTAHHTYAFSLPASSTSGERSPNASVISICPENDKRVLIGTRLGGAYFSFDGGSRWTPVTNSAPVVAATSIYWLPGCGSAYVGTYGRGIFRIDMHVHIPVLSHPCEPAVCALEAELAHRLRNPHPLPSAVRGVVVLDGFIQRVQHTKQGPRITVSDGSIVTAYEKLPHGTKIVDAAARARSQGTEAVFFLKGSLVRTLKGSELSLYQLPVGHTGKGLASGPNPPDVRIQIPGYPELYGNSFAVLPADAPLVLKVTFDQASADEVVLEVDGDVVAKYAPGQKEIDYAAKSSLASGQHTVTVLEETSKGLTPVAREPFAVANGDGEKEG